MDKNSIVGLVIIGAILLIFTYINKPSEEEKATQKAYYDSIALVNEQNAIAAAATNQASFTTEQNNLNSNTTSANPNVNYEDLYGAFGSGGQGEDRFISLENDKIKVVFSNKGGKVYSVELKEYTDNDEKPLILFDGDENIFGFNFFSQNRQIATNDLYFVPSTNDESIVINEGSNPYSITWRLNAGENSYLEYEYSLAPSSYELGFKINLVNLGTVMGANTNMLDLNWFQYVPQTEKGIENENNYTTICYSYLDGEYGELAARGKDDKSDNITTSLKWVAFKKQFFASIILAEGDFANALVQYDKVENKPGIIKSFNAELGIPVSNINDESLSFKFYFGPNSSQILKKYHKGYEDILPLGKSIIGWINKYLIINVFNWLGRSIANMGLIILLLTIFVKVLILPLTYKSYMSTAKMKVLKPEIDEIGKKFPKKEDSMKKQQATMALYKKVGISPLGGCLPMVIQFPILIAMFRFFPAAIELRHKSFLWADDLSTYDSILNLPFEIPMYGDHISLFTLLMAAALIVSTKLNSAAQTEATAQMPGMKFMMNWMMPAMMLLWFNNYAAGLSYYYFLSNLITIGQTYGIRKFVDEDKIHSQLHENAKKTKKKSNWQTKLEDIAKKQQQAAKHKR